MIRDGAIFQHPRGNDEFGYELLLPAGHQVDTGNPGGSPDLLDRFDTKIAPFQFLVLGSFKAGNHRIRDVRVGRESFLAEPILHLRGFRPGIEKSGV